MHTFQELVHTVKMYSGYKRFKIVNPSRQTLPKDTIAIKPIHSSGGRYFINFSWPGDFHDRHGRILLSQDDLRRIECDDFYSDEHIQRILKEEERGDHMRRYSRRKAKKRAEIIAHRLRKKGFAAYVLPPK